MSNFRFNKIFLSIGLIFSSLASSIEVLEVKILDSYSITKKFPGKLLPVEQSKLAFEIPGKINNVYVDVGDSVKKRSSIGKA